MSVSPVFDGRRPNKAAAFGRNMLATAVVRTYEGSHVPGAAACPMQGMPTNAGHPVLVVGEQPQGRAHPGALLPLPMVRSLDAWRCGAARSPLSPRSRPAGRLAGCRAWTFLAERASSCPGWMRIGRASVPEAISVAGEEWAARGVVRTFSGMAVLVLHNATEGGAYDLGAAPPNKGMKLTRPEHIGTS